MTKFFCILSAMFTAAMLYCGEYYACFAKNKWDKNDFQIVKAPRNDTVGAMIQNEDHIANQVPAGLTEHQMLSSKETYCALVCKKKFSGNITVSSKMSFDYQMAPLIVLAPELGTSADGKYPEFREHFEIILYNRGINIWHHQYKNGKQEWYKLAYLTADFAPHKIYELKVSLRRIAQRMQMTVSCGGREFECMLPANFSADGFFAGITGCEGVNRFYDFKVTQAAKKQ